MSATESPKESTLNPPAGSTELEKLRALIADDGFAATFQTMGRYRTALLQVASALARGATQNAEAVVTDHSVEVNKMVEEQAVPKTGEAGWRRLPIEPTQEMIEAMASAYLGQHGYADAFIKAMYAAAVAAAPTQQEGKHA